MNEVDLPVVRALLRPEQGLQERIHAFLSQRLGRVLPPERAKGLDWYYDSVVLGARALDAFDVLRRERHASGPVLDVGSGLGSFVLLANHFGMPAIGVELSEPELKLASERAHAVLPGKKAVFCVGSGDQLPVQDSTVSAVLLHDVLEHVDNWRTVLGECRRVLVDGGVLYVKGPSYAVRFVEPHYRLPWLPLLPRTLARHYLSVLGRDVGYLEHLGFRRRGEILRELRELGFSLRFPRLVKLSNPASINRPWVRRLLVALADDGRLTSIIGLAAENSLQSVVDVVGVVPADPP